MSESSISGLDLNEVISDKDVVYNINTFGADFTVDGLFKRFDRGDIFVPNFQRNYVWTWPQASKFIESVLLGLPIPSIFLYREERTQKHLIVDGLQRLTTLHSFFKGRFPHNDRVFRLKDVKKRFNNKTIEELDPSDRRRFEDSVIHAMIIQQVTPEDDNSSVYHIFDRLNSNGTPLQPQEIRNAIFHGNFQELLVELNENKIWREIFGPVHKRATDQELILRFLALFELHSQYKKPMKKFLNDYMSSKRDIDDSEFSAIRTLFYNTIQRANDAFGKNAFRPARSLNVANFDSLMIAIARHPTLSPSEIKAAAQSLLENAKYIESITSGTSDDSVVKTRIELANQAFNART
jgi:uncharacterized protein with ParB-like and HNH nuclease domain